MVKSGSKGICHLIIRGEVPFPLPATWLWVRLGDILEYDAGTKTDPEQLPRDAWLLELEDIEKNSGKIIQSIKVVDRSPKSTKSGFQQNDVLYGKLRPYLNKSVVADYSGFSTTEIVALRCYGESIPHYTCLALRRPDFVDYVTRLGQGTKMPRLRTEDAVSAPFPLPPIAEQHRIAAKVDELMALCDKVEAAQAKREKRRDRLVASTLHGLSNGNTSPAPDSRPAFKDSACFYLNHLPHLTTRPEHIHQLRQTILNLAVRGKLVPQDPDEEPASELLKRIDAEKSQLVKEGKIKQIPVPPPVSEGETPFEIPQTWRWVRVTEVAHCRLGKMIDKAKNKGTPRLYLRNLNVRWFDFDLSDLLEMRFEETELDEFSLKKGDVLICEGGEPGRAAVWGGRDVDVYFQKAVHRVRFFGLIVPIYFVRSLYQDAISGRLTQFFTGVGIKHFTGKGLSRYAFPLPPLAEQHRITEKVDEMMTLCDKLEDRLTANAAARNQLLEASLQEGLVS
jgi:type I restriction enzyme S subunit